MIPFSGFSVVSVIFYRLWFSLFIHSYSLLFFYPFYLSIPTLYSYKDYLIPSSLLFTRINNHFSLFSFHHSSIPPTFHAFIRRRLNPLSCRSVKSTTFFSLKLSSVIHFNNLFSLFMHSFQQSSILMSFHHPSIPNTHLQPIKSSLPPKYISFYSNNLFILFIHSFQ